MNADPALNQLDDDAREEQREPIVQIMRDRLSVEDFGSLDSVWINGMYDAAELILQHCAPTPPSATAGRGDGAGVRDDQVEAAFSKLDGYLTLFTDADKRAVVRDALQAVLASPAPEPAWRTMDSAPTEPHSSVVGWCVFPAGAEPRIVIRGAGGVWRAHGLIQQVTHWQPLPAPPASAPAAAEGGA